ncbi:MAG TPA: hypothetical protein VI670_25125 [Thermoanaerobaculia bacterium]|jgi:hypothetical protein
MTFDADSIFRLKRHFIGALSVAWRVRLDAAPSPRVLLTSGGGVLRGIASGCAVDFGTAASPGRERRTLRLAGLDSNVEAVAVAETPPWLVATWSASTSEVELVAEHDAAVVTNLRGDLRFLLTLAGGQTREEKLAVRLIARPTQALGRYNFYGHPRPQPVDFGVVDPADAAAVREIVVEPLTSVPLIVSFHDLPAWLTFACDGEERRGPIAGRFFERPAPFRAALRPIASRPTLGPQRGAMRIRTNDGDPFFHDVALELSAIVEPRAPFVVAAAPRDGEQTRRRFTAAARLENWGREHARMLVRELDPALEVRSLPVVPPAHQGRPGVAVLPIGIDAAKLGAGLHPLSITLGVIEGEPPIVTVPLRVNVVPRPPR